MRRTLVILAVTAAAALAAAGCGDDDASKTPPPYEPPPVRPAPPAPAPPEPPTIDAAGTEAEVELSPRECVSACRKRNMARAVGADVIDSDCYAECEASCRERCVERAKRRGDPSEHIEKDCTDGCKIRRGI